MTGTKSSTLKMLLVGGAVALGLTLTLVALAVDSSAATGDEVTEQTTEAPASIHGDTVQSSAMGSAHADGAQSDCGAAADATELLEVAAGGSCGGATCRKGTYCCNASCARCVPFGMSCTQESCN